MSLSRNTAANLIGRVCSAVLGIALVPVYLHFLGLESFALIGVWGLLQGTFSVMDFGFGNAFAREMARLSASPDAAHQQRELLVTFNAIHWLLAGATMLLVWIIAPVIAVHWVHAEHVSIEIITSSIRLMGFTVAVQFPISLYQGGLLALQRQVLYNTLFIATTLIRGFGTIAVLWLISPTIEAFFIWQAMMAGFSAAVHWIALDNVLTTSHERASFQRSWITRLWRYAAGSAGNSLGIFFAQQFDKVILTKTLPLQQFAYYTLAGTFSTLLWTCVSAVGVAAIPRFNQCVALGNHVTLADEYARANQLVATVLMPVSLVLIFFTREALTLWTANPALASDVENLVRFFLIGMTLAGLANMTLQLALSYGWFRLTLAFTWITGLISMPLYWFASERWGVLGAGLIYMLQNAAFVLIVPLFHRRYLRGHAITWFSYAFVRPILATVAICSILRLIAPASAGPIVMIGVLALAWTLSTLSVAMLEPSVRDRIFRLFTRWHVQHYRPH